MNFLPFIFSLLALIALLFASFTDRFSVTEELIRWERQSWDARRSYLSEITSHAYKHLGARTQASSSATEERYSGSEQLCNDPCARLNIALLLKGERDPALQLAAMRILKAYYPQVEADALLNSMIAASHGKVISLEKLQPAEGALYYQLLKGRRGEYPSLLELFVSEAIERPLCLRHASCKFIQALFGEEAGNAIYQEIHPKGSQRVSLSHERIRDICSLHGELNPLLLSLVETKWHKLESVRWRGSDSSGNVQLERIRSIGAKEEGAE